MTIEQDIIDVVTKSRKLGRDQFRRLKELRDKFYREYLDEDEVVRLIAEVDYSSRRLTESPLQSALKALPKERQAEIFSQAATLADNRIQLEDNPQPEPVPVPEDEDERPGRR